MTTGPCLDGVRLLLCDADGNLFPSEEPAFVASADVTNRFLASIDVSARFTAEELRLATTGRNFRTTAVDLAASHGVAAEAVELLDAWVEEEKQVVSAYLGDVLRPDPDVVDPLTRLAGRLELALVSSSALTRLDTCLRATGLAGLFPAPVRFSAEDSLPRPTSKPDPAVYLHALAELDAEPAHAVAVEDSLPGALSAVAAGVRTVGNVAFVPPGERAERRELLTGAGVVAVVESWPELESLLH